MLPEAATRALDLGATGFAVVSEGAFHPTLPALVGRTGVAFRAGPNQLGVNLWTTWASVSSLSLSNNHAACGRTCWWEQIYKRRNLHFLVQAEAPSPSAKHTVGAPEMLFEKRYGPLPAPKRSTSSQSSHHSSMEAMWHS